MIIGLLTAIFLISGTSGSESIFLDPDVKKHVKNYVTDKNTQDEILAFLKDFEKEFKEIRKDEVDLAEQFHALTGEPNHTRSEFETIVQKMTQLRDLRQGSFTSSAVKLRAMISEEEWRNIIAAIDDKIDKQLDDKGKFVQKEEARTLFEAR